MRSLPVFLLLLLCLPLAAIAQDTPEESPPESTPAVLREKAEKALEAIGAGNREQASVLTGQSVEERDLDTWRQALAKRIETLKLLQGVQEEQGRSEAYAMELADRLTEARSALQMARDQKPDPVPSAGVTQADLGAAQAERDKRKAEVDVATKSLGERREALKLHETRLTAFPIEQAELIREIADAEGLAPEGIDAYRLDNRRLRLRYLEAWLAFAPNQKPLLETRRELRETELQTAQAHFDRARDYLKRLGAVLEKDDQWQAQQARNEARDIAKALEEEKDPERRKELERKKDLLELKAGAAEDRAFLRRVERLLEEEEEANADLRGDLQWIKERFEEGGEASTRTAEVLGNLDRRTRGIAGELREEDRPWLSKQQAIYGTARADVSDRLREVARERNDPELEAALQARSASAGAVVAKLRTLDTVYRQRTAILAELQPLLINRIYRIRSDRPLDLKTIQGIPEEAGRLTRIYTSERVRGGLVEAYRSGKWRFIVFGVGFLFLLGLGGWLVRKLGHQRTRWSYRGGRLLVMLQRVLSAVLLSALGPLALVLATQLLKLLEVPAEFTVPGEHLLYGLAAILFVRRFTWSLFREDGIAVAEFGASPEVAGQLHRVSRWATLGLLILVLPWLLLTRVPIQPVLVHLPRVIYTLTLAFYGVLLSGLLLRRRPLVTSLTGGAGFGYQAWFFLWPVFTLGFLGIVVMDVLGYRYGALRLVAAVGQTLLAAFLIAGLYNLSRALIDNASKKVRRQLLEELGRSEARTEAAEALNQVTRFASVVIVVVALFLLANFWGLGSTAESLFGSVRIVTIDAAADQFVMLWDVLRALLWIVGAHFLIMTLPGLFQFVLFPRLGKIDTGTKFVILAVSRYLIILIAYSAAILTLQISFSSLGYIFAALSVGIGFGLQEVVSNFISGLLLFLERPVRVGDLVEVGGVSGIVNKISIRATEVINFDRQVIIIPNRQFITERVTNWSHNDQNVRLTIDVGVSYSEDVGQVARILNEILEQNPRVLKNPPARVIFHQFGDSSLNFWVRPFTTIDDRMVAIHELNEEIMRRFREEGIEIPFPQRDLHLRSVDKGVRFAIGPEQAENPGEELPPPEDG